MREGWKYRRGDIYFANLGTGVGSEQGGTRPVLVIQNDIGNAHAPTLTVIPITSNLKKLDMPTHCVFEANAFLKGTSMVMAEQILTIDKKRIVSYAGHMTESQFEKVLETVRIHLGLEKE